MYEVYDSQTGQAVEEQIDDLLIAHDRAAEYNRVRKSTQYAVRPMTEPVVGDVP